MSQSTDLHVGIIMDGNGRWATNRGMPRLVGHTRGAMRVKEIIRSSSDMGISTLSLYAFSTDNWKRSVLEIEGVMKLIDGYLRDHADEMHAENVKVRFFGDPEPLPMRFQTLMTDVASNTRDNSGLNLNIAINYGGRDDVTRSIKAIVADALAGKIIASSIDEQMIESYLDTKEQPHPDLIIRTAGEQRLSNFLGWQSAYSELIFMDLYWPDFGTQALSDALKEFRTRNRQFGGQRPINVHSTVA